MPKPCEGCGKYYQAGGIPFRVVDRKKMCISCINKYYARIAKKPRTPKDEEYYEKLKLHWGIPPDEFLQNSIG